MCGRCVRTAISRCRGSAGRGPAATAGTWSEVPLGEDSERYEVDILDGDDVVRTIASTTPSATYTAAEQVADFGAEQSVVQVAVHQMSAVYGRGSAKRAVV